MNKYEATAWLANVVSYTGYKPTITERDRAETTWNGHDESSRRTKRYTEGEAFGRALLRECAEFIRATEGVTWGDLSNR